MPPPATPPVTPVSLFPSGRWFAQGPNPHNKAQDWLFSKGYWERNYNQLPNIY